MSPSIVGPQRHVAELVALRAAGRWGLRWSHSSSRRPRRGSSKAEEDSWSAKANEQGVFDTETSGSTEQFERIGGNPALPLPPFLRQTSRRSLSPFEQHLRASSAAKKEVQGTYIEGNKYKRQVKLQKAPFATRMQENPYARMLAESIREERFAGQRLPRSMLLRFSLVEDEESTDVVPGQAQDAASDASPQLTLLPLSLFGEAIPKKKKSSKLNDEELRAAEALHQASSGFDGASSYILARQDMLSWISANTRQRAERMLGSGTRQSLDRSGRTKSSRSKAPSFVWNKDMAEMVLRSMRKVVRRQLRFLMDQKRSADRPGIMMQVPQLPEQRGGLAMLDRVDDAMCVLRMIRSVATDEGLVARSKQELEHEIVEPMWMADEQKRLMWGQRAQSSVEAEAGALYPTVRYRNRRVPLYDLQQLLGGGDAVKKLVDKTSFAESEWVTLSSSLFTQPLLQWLFRLHSYLAYESDTST